MSVLLKQTYIGLHIYLILPQSNALALPQYSFHLNREIFFFNLEFGIRNYSHYFHLIIYLGSHLWIANINIKIFVYLEILKILCV